MIARRPGMVSSAAEPPAMRERPAEAFASAPLAVVTCHFNFAGYRRPVANLLRFVRGMERDGIPVYGIEAVLAGQQPVMAGRSRWRVERLSARARLWQKEPLLNAAVEMVPRRFGVIAMVDADLHFDNPEWAWDAVNALGQFPVVQPWETAIWTREDGSFDLSRDAVGKVGFDATWNGHPGFAWAAPREFWEQVGFYPWCVVGNGDSATAAGLTGIEPFKGVRRGVGERNLASGIYDEWRGKAQSWMGGEPVGWCRGALFHEWHGDRADRKYWDRANLIRGFDARRDAGMTSAGWIHWTRQADPGMVAGVSDYFSGRAEDG